METINFIDIAKNVMGTFVEEGWNISSYRRCRGEDHVKLQKGQTVVDIGYEPFDIPWAFCQNSSGRGIALHDELTPRSSGTHEEIVRDFLRQIKERIIKEVEPES